jgi:putative component of membrane protein insertase Oxa1/YidC/SpoIIIJ protein YidD
MQSIVSQSLTQQIATEAINLYQNHVSPYKGFSCPHRILHQGDSCSEYVKKLITEQSLISAIEGSLQRFRNCAEASKTLQNQSSGGCIVIPCCIPI